MTWSGVPRAYFSAGLRLLQDVGSGHENWDVVLKKEYKAVPVSVQPAQDFCWGAEEEFAWEAASSPDSTESGWGGIDGNPWCEHFWKYLFPCLCWDIRYVSWMHYFCLFFLFLIMSASLGGFFCRFFWCFFPPKVCDLVFKIFRTVAGVQKSPDFILSVGTSNWIVITEAPLTSQAERALVLIL